MKESRFNLIYKSLTAVAKKVYEATPIQEPWSITQIVGELHREGRQIEHNIAAGCLVSLKDVGLITEPTRGQFIRVAIRSKQETTIEPKTQATTQESEKQMPAMTTSPATAAKEAAQSPIDKLSALANKVNSMMAGLKSLANEIENSALEIEEQMQAKEAELVKFRQLQALLKGIA